MIMDQCLGRTVPVSWSRWGWERGVRRGGTEASRGGTSQSRFDGRRGDVAASTPNHQTAAVTSFPETCQTSPIEQRDCHSSRREKRSNERNKIKRERNDKTRNKKERNDKTREKQDKTR